MKIKKSSFTSQFLILLLASLVLGLMLMAQAQAQTESLVQNTTQNQQAQMQVGNNQSQVLRMDMPQKSFGRELLDNTTFNYYHQFLGPTVGSSSGGETYNVFIEGRSPYQSFHAMSLRYQLPKQWAVGASLAAVNVYGDTTTSQQTGIQSELSARDEFFNARAFVSTPALPTRAGTLFTTISYEAPTSNFARENDMRFGWVLAQSFAFNIPSHKWTSGLNWQYYRMYYQQNVLPARNGMAPLPLQTTIFSGGPYLNYRFNDKWMMGSSIILDWDQRGGQADTQSFNNNLPDRARMGLSYFPAIKYLSSVGVFTQTLLKYTVDTHAVGGEFAVRF
jgi:hypothetical protein